ncbi:hypothetical protein BYT27DRAFT_7211812 [Phlegmacium glaucopus]|nr:hypothetical protein BYT27DRAFT_7211812 [Phlegmacium glaucopus]
MPALKSAFLSLLLLTVASCVEGNTTITLLQVIPIITPLSNGTTQVQAAASLSAIGVGENGGTTYLEGEILTGVELGGTMQVITATRTFVEAASWFYTSPADPSKSFDDIELNCTLGTNGATSECIEIDRFVLQDGTTSKTATLTYQGLVEPIYTLTVPGPIPTSTNAATILGSPIPTSTNAATILGSPIFSLRIEEVNPLARDDLQLREHRG